MRGLLLSLLDKVSRGVSWVNFVVLVLTSQTGFLHIVMHEIPIKANSRLEWRGVGSFLLSSFLRKKNYLKILRNELPLHRGNDGMSVMNQEDE
jgi:hypothetical protein